VIDGEEVNFFTRAYAEKSKKMTREWVSVHLKTTAEKKQFNALLSEYDLQSIYGIDEERKKSAL